MGTNQKLSSLEGHSPNAFIVQITYTKETSILKQRISSSGADRNFILTSLPVTL